MENQEDNVKVYLDVCCLCRPLDNQLIPKIRYESEAVIAILNRCSRDWELIWSSAIMYEVAKIVDHDKKTLRQHLRSKGNHKYSRRPGNKGTCSLFHEMGCKST